MAVHTLPFIEALNSLKLPALYKNLFSSPQWLRVLDKTYQLKLFVKYIERNGEVDSYIVYSVVKNFLEWKICICSYCDYFDCVVTHAEDWQAYFESLRQEYPRYRIAIRTLRNQSVKENPNFQILSKEKFHYIDLRPSLDNLWQNTHDSFKSAVKQGQKNGLKIRACEKKELKKFYQFHLKLRKNKYRLFPQPYRFFCNVWEEFMETGKGVLLGAFTSDGNFIAGNIYLVCGNAFYYKFNTSGLKSLKLRPNNLLFWEGVKLAKERNLEYLDLGSSGCEQTGLILFKTHAGAKERDIVHIGYAPPHYKFSRKRILTGMTRLFTSPWMPDCMVSLGSGWIYPYLA